MCNIFSETVAQLDIQPRPNWLLLLLLDSSPCGPSPIAPISRLQIKKQLSQNIRTKIQIWKHMKNKLSKQEMEILLLFPDHGSKKCCRRGFHKKNYKILDICPNLKICMLFKPCCKVAWRREFKTSQNLFVICPVALLRKKIFQEDFYFRTYICCFSPVAKLMEKGI